MSIPLSAKAARSILKEYRDGITAQQMVDYVNERLGEKLALPTVRKYVQLGFLARSTRRGLGYRQGSRGYYPATTLVQLLRVREQLRAGWTLQGLTDSPFGLTNQLEDLRARLGRMTTQMGKLMGSGRDPRSKALRQTIADTATQATAQIVALEKIVRDNHEVLGPAAG